MNTMLTLLDALQDRLMSDVGQIESQFLHETSDEMFQFLKGRKKQCTLVLEYIAALRKAGDVSERGGKTAR